jgi:hypothetical protein
VKAACTEKKRNKISPCVPSFPSFFSSAILVLGACLAVLSSSCVGKKGLFGSESPYHTSSYKKNLEVWTREARIHRGFQVVLIAHATLKSAEYRRAYGHEYATALRLTPQEEEKFIEDQLQAATLGWEFLMATFVPEKAWDDFDQPGSMWRLFLVKEKDRRLAPLEVRRVKGRDPVLAHFFPYISPHKSVYIVRFPLDHPDGVSPVTEDTTKPLKMVITSVLGSAEMDWQIEDAPQQGTGRLSRLATADLLPGGPPSSLGEDAGLKKRDSLIQLSRLLETENGLAYGLKNGHIDLLPSGLPSRVYRKKAAHRPLFQEKTFLMTFF